MTQCTHPCRIVAANQGNLEKLRAHLLEGYQCLDAWLALSQLVSDPRQRKDCLERASVLAPDNQQIQIAYLEAYIALEPNDILAQCRLAEIRTMQLLVDVKSAHFHEKPKARLIGDILIAIGAITNDELHEVLHVQSTGSLIATDRRLGQLLLKKGLITPSKLAHALIVQQQERSKLRIAPQVLGEYMVEQNYVTPQQLELALAEQLRLDQKGQRLSLGQILVRLNLVSQARVDEAARDHVLSFWAKFGY
ncbi:MAG: hypothetical protein WCJ55_04600 [Chloroflexales bacterium]